MRGRVLVTLKQEVLDPQGEAVRRGLTSLGFEGVREVRVGKVIEVELDDGCADPRALIESAARKLLVNSVIEDFEVELLGDAERS